MISIDDEAQESNETFRFEDVSSTGPDGKASLSYDLYAEPQDEWFGNIGGGEYHIVADRADIELIERRVRLMVAAPDLLEACQVALGWFNTSRKDQDAGDCAAAALLEAAINRAEPKS